MRDSRLPACAAAIVTSLPVRALACRHEVAVRVALAAALAFNAGGAAAAGGRASPRAIEFVE
jgi:hypothetical protein